MDNSLGTYRRRIGASWEALYPLAMGLIVLIVWHLSGTRISQVCETHQWHLDEVYSATFGFLSIITGFLATFYGTIQSISTGFIGRIKETNAMTLYLLYIKRGIILGFFSSILTIPMMIVSPVPVERSVFTNLAVSCWFGLAAWAIAGFWRVASQLFFLFETKGPIFRHGG